MFLAVAETILLVRFFIFCGVVWILSYVFKSFLLRHLVISPVRNTKKLQWEQTPLIQFITWTYESFLFPEETTISARGFSLS